MYIQYYKNKNILITGHTGFKGMWLSMILQLLGANVIGYSNGPLQGDSLYELIPNATEVEVMGDICDVELLKKTIRKYKVQYVFHLAAQSIVNTGVQQPFKTFETNAMGSVSILEAIRYCSDVKGVVFVTTDKVYYNFNCHNHPFSEEEKLWGVSPYAASKCCAELIVDTYYQTYWKNHRKIGVAVVRAGNVIGGGDFAKFRIIPDCVRAWKKKEPIVIRHPNAIRDYQHVLDVLFAYLDICQFVCKDIPCFQIYNVGPELESLCTTLDLITKFFQCLNISEKNFVIATKQDFIEDKFLILNSNKLRNDLNFRTLYTLDEAIQKTANWYKVWNDGRNLTEISKRQIDEYICRKWGC